MIKTRWFGIVNAIYKHVIYICEYEFEFLIYNYEAAVGIVFANRVYNFKLQIQTTKSEKCPIFARFGMRNESPSSCENTQIYAILSVPKKALTCYFSEDRALFLL